LENQSEPVLSNVHQRFDTTHAIMINFYY